MIRNLLKPSQGRIERLTLNSLTATRFVGIRTGTQGDSQPVNATLVTGPSGAIFVLTQAASSPAALQAAGGALAQAQSSFRAMSAADRAAARPWTLRTVPYPAGGFAQLARSTPLPSAEQQLRLINGFYAGGEPRVGQLVKMVD